MPVEGAIVKLVELVDQVPPGDGSEAAKVAPAHIEGTGVIDKGSGLTVMFTFTEHPKASA